jgi:hypothetical protein
VVQLSPQVKLRVQSSPPGAEAVLDAGGPDAPELRDHTPFSAQIPRSIGVRRLTLRAKGYRSASVDVVPDSDSSVTLALVPEVVAPPPPPPPRAVTRSSHRVEKKPAPAPAPAPTRPATDLRRGDVVDPFDR